MIKINAFYYFTVTKKGLSNGNYRGKVEHNETLVEAARRELQEELGVTVNIKKQLGEASFTDSQDNDYHYTWFLASITSGTPSIHEPDTFDDLRYFNLTKLEMLQLSANMQAFASQLKNKQISLT